jgi:hypothetical protein
MTPWWHLFTVSLNAEQGSVALQQFDVPHVAAACANGVTVDLPTLKRLGASKDLTDALEAAQNLQPKKTAPAKR